MIKSISCKTEENWLEISLEYLADLGVVVIRDVLSDSFIEDAKRELYSVQAQIRLEIGEFRLNRAGELGVCRLPLHYSDFFLNFLETPELLKVLDSTVSNTAILHLQNGFILPSEDVSVRKQQPIFQQSFHMDFPRVLNGYLASINAFFALDEFTERNGCTVVLPGSHQRVSKPSLRYMLEASVPLLCEAGSMIIFDSTLWHAAGHNSSGDDRVAINHQFVRSFFKQQIDCTKAIDKSRVLGLPARTQQLLGHYSQPPGSLDEYYVESDRRSYKAGQG
ncbi:MAG: phytanoyl-CoA dioxygenase family protein [Candidatus Obscuribacterales bacterium]|jgi:ectoine hydroxylase-related dioxygenase (phytanoyl-CoA dioxygenase family)